MAFGPKRGYPGMYVFDATGSVSEHMTPTANRARFPALFCPATKPAQLSIIALRSACRPTTTAAAGVQGLRLASCLVTHVGRTSRRLGGHSPAANHFSLSPQIHPPRLHPNHPLLQCPSVVMAIGHLVRARAPKTTIEHPTSTH